MVRYRVGDIPPLPMSAPFLTLREAEEFTGKSRSTLRRFLDTIVKEDDHPDRPFLQPPPEEVAEMKGRNQPFSWRISEELLKRQFGVGESEAASAPSAGGGETDRLVAVLEKSIAMLEKELNEKNSQIAQLHERQREHNVLLRDLQERLALTAPRQTEAEEGSYTSASPEKPAPSKRDSLWSRPLGQLFRRPQ